ncbi:MAG: VWA domain-containing protein [Deltaproteobacteria bacterium]|nr:VWA domain-containing protein [Deltaproteobacteria bacterium]
MTATAAVQIPMVDVKEQKRGVGVLELLGPKGRVELPLAGVAIEAKVSSFVAEVTVRQTFKNPHTEALEAEYVFPLAGGCAVGRFELRVAGRVVVGKVEERGEARRQYQEALAQGKRAAILEQERSNVFTVKVGNLPPGEEAQVLLTYSERLAFFEDGASELRLPLVVAPRYVGGQELEREQSGSGVVGDSTTVPDASRLSPPRLAPGFDAKVGLAIDVSLLLDKGGAGFADLSCSQHATRTGMTPEAVRVSLSRVEKLDRDFVLRWRMGGAAITSGMQVFQPAEGPAYGLVTLVPPRREGFLGLARRVVFVVDRSGSMEGVKMTSASRACALLLRTLGPRDAFAVQAFDNVADWMEGGKFLQADEAGIEKGEAFLRGIGARGGTELDLAMREAIDAFKKDERKEAGLPIVVLLTDGQIGDEASVLKRLQKSLGEVRVFTVGIDTAVNDGFLKRLSAIGGGTATFVEPGSALEEALRNVGREIGAPLVTDLKLVDEGSGLDPLSLAPMTVPDLFEGRCASVLVRLKNAGGRITVTGKHVDGSKFKQTIEAQAMPLPALAQLWAKGRVTDLEDRFRMANSGAMDVPPDQLKAEIVSIACAHSILTRFTAFIAVDQEIVNPGGQGRMVVQPVEMPADWELQKEGGIAGPPQVQPMIAQAGLPGGMPLMRSMAARAAPAPMALGGAGSGGMAKASFEEVEMDAAESAADLMMPASSVAAPPPPPMTPAPSPVAASPKKAKGGLMNKVASVFGGGGRRERSDDAKKADKSGSTASAKETAAVHKAITELEAALKAAQADLANGKVPAAGALAGARGALMSLLASYADAARMPLLQKFLRTAAAELVAALSSGADARSLTALFSRHAAAFAAAKSEAMSGAPADTGKEPWEAKI